MCQLVVETTRNDFWCLTTKQKLEPMSESVLPVVDTGEFDGGRCTDLQ